MPRFRTPSLLLALAAFVTLGGCDAIEEAAGINQIEVSTGAAGRLDLAPDSAIVASADVNIGQDLPGSVDVDGMAIPEDALTYAASGAAAPAPGEANLLATCNVGVTVLMDGVPAMSGPVTIDDQTLAVSHDIEYAADFDSERFCSAFPGGDCPVVRDYTGDEIDAAVTGFIRAGRFALKLVADTDGPCGGLLNLAELEFDLGI